MESDDQFFDKLKKYIKRARDFLGNKVWEKSFLLKRCKREAEEAMDSVDAAYDDLVNQINNIGKEGVIAKKKQLKDIPDGTVAVYIHLNQKKRTQSQGLGKFA